MKKRFFLVALLLALTFLATCAVALADDGIEVPPPEMISDNLNFSIVDWYRDVLPIDDELKLVRMTAAISKYDSTHVYVKGVTQANKTCGHIKGYLGVQQWKNNKWNTYTIASYTAFNTHEASRETTLAVESGYYYRLIVDHFVSAGKEDVAGTTVTSSILIN